MVHNVSEREQRVHGTQKQGSLRPSAVDETEGCMGLLETLLNHLSTPQRKKKTPRSGLRSGYVGPLKYHSMAPEDHVDAPVMRRCTQTESRRDQSILFGRIDIFIQVPISIRGDLNVRSELEARLDDGRVPRQLPVRVARTFPSMKYTAGFALG